MITYNGYLNYELPDEWCYEETDDNLILYNPDGDGAVTISSFNVVSQDVPLNKRMSMMAQSFVMQNNIELYAPMEQVNGKHKTVLSGAGTMDDGSFIKIWMVGCYPKIVVATYLGDEGSADVDICDAIIDSFRFVL